MPRLQPSPRRARLGVSAMFFTNGAILSSLLPRYPEIKDSFGLTNGQFGLLVIGFPVGAILAAAFAGMATRRVGVLRVAGLGSVLLAAALAVAGASSVVWLFAAAMIIAGALDAIVDAAQNVQGVVVEQRRGRSIMNSFHAVWSIGAAVGGGIGAAAAAASVSLGTQMLINGCIWASVAVLATGLAHVPDNVRTDLRVGTDDTKGAPVGFTTRGHVWRLLLPLVLLACCGTLVEDVANNWVALYLRQEAAAPEAIAGLGLVAMLGAQFVGRLVGDPMTDRWGREAVAQAGGLLIAIGATVAVISPVYPLAIGGFALAGLGSATLVPAAFAAAGRIPGLPEGSGIAIISWLMRIGFLITSPSIGFISGATNLRVAMVVPIVGGLAAALLAYRTSRVPEALHRH